MRHKLELDSRNVNPNNINVSLEVIPGDMPFYVDVDVIDNVCVLEFEYNSKDKNIVSVFYSFHNAMFFVGELTGRIYRIEFKNIDSISGFIENISCCVPFDQNPRRCCNHAFGLKTVRKLYDKNFLT